MNKNERAKITDKIAKTDEIINPKNYLSLSICFMI